MGTGGYTNTRVGCTTDECENSAHTSFCPVKVTHPSDNKQNNFRLEGTLKMPTCTLKSFPNSNQVFNYCNHDDEDPPTLTIVILTQTTMFI